MNKIVKKICPQNAILLLCDVQDKYTPRTFNPETVVETLTMFCELASIFKIPTLITQQNPPVFGKTYPQFTQNLKQTTYVIKQKTTFSMFNNQTNDFFNEYKNRNQVILVGLQAHICVYQTFSQLIQRNYDVFLGVDGITSAKQIDRTVGIQRMMQSGAIVSSFENIAFEMLKDYKNDKFKPVLNILKKYKRQKIFTHL